MVHQATIAVRRFRAEAELLKTAEQFNIFFSESLDLLCIADTDGYFRRDPGVGARPATRRGAGPHEVPRPRPPRRPRRPRSARSERLGQGLPESRFVNRYRTKDGEYRYLEWRAFPRGDLIYAAARDLTERIEADQAIRVSEARYRLIADNTADVIWILDVRTMRFTYVSPSVERLRGYTVHEVLEQSDRRGAHAGVAGAGHRRELPCLIAAFQAATCPPGSACTRSTSPGETGAWCPQKSRPRS